jgi:uncharacterized protein DUF4041/Meiotically Up-regulated Gene 113 (MUG113) protein
MTITVIVLAVVVAGLLFLLTKKIQDVKQAKDEIAQRAQELDNYKSQYKDIIDVDKAVAAKNDELRNVAQSIDTLRANYDKQNEQLKQEYTAKRSVDIADVDRAVAAKNDELRNVAQSINTLKANYDKQDEQLKQEYTSKRSIYEALLSEISIVEEDLENISYGLYKPHFDYQTSEEYKQKLEEIWKKEKEIIKSNRATYCPTEWSVGGSKVEGRKMVKHQAKLMLRAFNGECDSAIAKVSWNNIGNVEARITKAYQAINNLGSTQNISITEEYAYLKLQELHLEFELEEKLYREKEEQRAIREQMREEEKALREMEKAKRDAEQEEERYLRALRAAIAETAKTSGAERDALNERIRQLEKNLQEAHVKKERAISRAQLTKSGHVYIISNIGSFGDHVHKIGMTRRLEPIDRVNELGDASVPFDFDVHGMIYSENAPELENILHKKFDHRRVNLVNRRAEFFNVHIDEIEAVVSELNLTVQLTKIAEAKEYRETQSIKEASEKEKQLAQQSEKVVAKKLDKFPTTLN